MSRRNLDVLLLQSLGHIERCQSTSGELGRVEPDTHSVFAFAEDIHVSDTGNALERIADVDVDVVGDELIGEAVIRRGKAGHQDKVGVGLGDRDAGVIDRGRQATGRRGDAILNVYRGNREIVAGLKRDRDGGGTVVGRHGRDVAHTLDAVDGLLERNCDGGLDNARVGAHVVGRDDHLGWRQLRIQRDRKRRNGDRAGQDNQQRADGGEDGTANEKIYQAGFLFLLLQAQAPAIATLLG